MNMLTRPTVATKSLRSVIGITAICLPLFAGLSGVAQAAECSPQQVRSLSIKNARLVKEGTTIVGVSMQVQSIVKNTNPRRAYRGNHHDFATISTVNSSTSHDMHTDKFWINEVIRGGGVRRHISDRFTIERDNRDRSKFQVNITGKIVNHNCEPGKQISITKARFDFNPVLRGGKPKHLGTRITGYSEAVRPRPRPGQGAPRPRNTAASRS